MRGDDLIESMFRSLDAAKLARPDIPSEELMATLGGDGKAQSIAEFEASGEEMVFVCVPVKARDYAGDDIVAGSIIRPCDGCLCDIWMSPATCGLSTRISHKRILCLKCSVTAIPK